MSLVNTRFRDIAGRETKARSVLTARHDQFLAKEKDRKYLTPAEQEEMQRIKDILDAIDAAGDALPEVAEPLFVAARKLFNDGDGLLSDRLQSHASDGVLIFVDDGNNDAVVSAALTLGLLVADNAAAPPVVLLDNDPITDLMIAPDITHPDWQSITQAFFVAIGEARGMRELAALVLPILASEGDPDGRRGPLVPTVDVEEFARVMRELRKRGVTARDHQLRRRVNEALDKVQSVGENGPAPELGINLPDLNEISDSAIVAENVRLMGPMIVSAMFDELRIFETVEMVVERWRDGSLPIGAGEAGGLLYKYWREAPNRISEMERRTFYAITMGVPGGEHVERSNKDFNDLWLRYVSIVSDFVSDFDTDHPLQNTNQQKVRKGARDLIYNLSHHGYGMAYYAAVELQDQIKFMIRLLSDKEILGAYGARDMWQVVDQVATLELGGARNSSRYRTLATCGMIITAWLARNVRRINASTGQLLDIDEIRHPTPKLSGQLATTHPNDYDLVNACELWLADTAISDSRIEELAQPREAPVTTSRPVQMPQMVRDMLDGMGGLGVGLGQRR